MVRAAGLEPEQCCHRQDLNLVRLPISPPALGQNKSGHKNPPLSAAKLAIVVAKYKPPGLRPLFFTPLQPVVGVEHETRLRTWPATSRA